MARNEDPEDPTTQHVQGEADLQGLTEAWLSTLSPDERADFDRVTRQEAINQRAMRASEAFAAHECLAHPDCGPVTALGQSGHGHHSDVTGLWCWHFTNSWLGGGPLDPPPPAGSDAAKRRAHGCIDGDPSIHKTYPTAGPSEGYWSDSLAVAAGLTRRATRNQGEVPQQAEIDARILAAENDVSQAVRDTFAAGATANEAVQVVIAATAAEAGDDEWTRAFRDRLRMHGLNEIVRVLQADPSKADEFESFMRERAEQATLTQSGGAADPQPTQGATTPDASIESWRSRGAADAPVAMRAISRAIFDEPHLGKASAAAIIEAYGRDMTRVGPGAVNVHLSDARVKLLSSFIADANRTEWMAAFLSAPTDYMIQYRDGFIGALDQEMVNWAAKPTKPPLAAEIVAEEARWQRALMMGEISDEDVARFLGVAGPKKQGGWRRFVPGGRG